MSFTPDELRLVSIGGHTWIAMLEASEKRLLDKIHGEFRNGKTDFLTLIAEFAVIRDQIRQLKSAINQQNQKGE